MTYSLDYMVHLTIPLYGSKWVWGYNYVKINVNLEVFVSRAGFIIQPAFD